jgi:hypothetical protein
MDAHEVAAARIDVAGRKLRGAKERWRWAAKFIILGPVFPHGTC